MSRKFFGTDGVRGRANSGAMTADMVLRMYLRWAADRGFLTETIEASPGEEAGLKSTTFTVEGENAYGILKAERGKHRLVRLSPFDQAHRRHTSFAQVIPSPLLADEPLVVMGDAIAETNRVRAGAGGPLDADDVRAVLGSVRGFLTDETRGMEQFYYIVQHRSLRR